MLIRKQHICAGEQAERACPGRDSAAEETPAWLGSALVGRVLGWSGEQDLLMVQWSSEKIRLQVAPAPGEQAGVLGEGGQGTTACLCALSPNDLDEGGSSSKTIPNVFGFASIHPAFSQAEFHAI